MIVIEKYSHYINNEFLLTALPTGLATFTFAALLKTKSKAKAIKRSVMWTIVIGYLYLVIGIGNDNYRVIFENIGIYILLGCVFTGPNLYAKTVVFTFIGLMGFSRRSIM